jgi:hypothetical protein
MRPKRQLVLAAIVAASRQLGLLCNFSLRATTFDGFFPEIEQGVRDIL